MQITFNFNTAKPGRSRKKDPSTSVAAGQSVNASALENQVCAYLLFIYPADKSSKELAVEMGLERITISPRLKPLETQGRVKRTGVVRDGCQTWVAIK